MKSSGIWSTNLVLFVLLFMLGIILLCGSSWFTKSPSLVLVARNGDTNQLKRLILAGRSVDETFGTARRTALMIAARAGNENVVRILLDQGAQVTATDINGKSAIDFALENAHTNIALMLRTKLSSNGVR